jgi:AcrR family transcriptional regulator
LEITGRRTTAFATEESMTQSNRQRLGRSEARDIILGAAARVFNQKGNAVTVEDIAQEAGYSTSALYKHFSNKEDILRTLWTRVGEQMIDLFQSEPPVKLPFIKRLKWTLYRMAQMAEDTREFFLAGMANTPMDKPVCRLEQDCLEYFKTMRAAMMALMQRGIDEGVLKPRDPRIYSSALGGHLHSLTMQWALFGPYPLKPRIDEALELFLTGAASDEVREAYLADSPSQ